jgi:hypothetical protein
MRQADRAVVHLLYYPMERRAATFDVIEDVVPLHDLVVSLRGDWPVKARLEPQGVDLAPRVLDGRIVVEVPVMAGHAMVVFSNDIEP